MSQLTQQLLDRFLRYVNIPSQSKAGVAAVPSTPDQWHMAQQLEAELEVMDLENIQLSDRCVLTGMLPANLPAGFTGTVPKIGFCCHLDTVDVNLSPQVHPQVIRNYPGGDVVLNADKNIVMKAADHPELADYVGQDIVFTDGTSVLGADNKAALANVMTMLQTLTDHPEIHHGDIYVAFVPDEEVGLKGSKSLDISRFPVDFAYTIDCCALGEVVYETFNAGAATVEIQGISAHPMNAKGNLVNPTLLAVDFANFFDRKETPECTEGTEGYIWIKSIQSNASQATVQMAIRDHDKTRYEARKQTILANVERLKAREPRARIRCTLEDIYGNIADAMTSDNREAVNFLYEALAELAITPKNIAMRGGTDGSWLSTQGIFTPNYFTGALNFHSRYEFLPLPSLEKSCQVTLKLVEKVFRKAAEK
ncbi:MAG: peptidase T [Acidaminococcus fermentans]|uniref:peptidase T n=1 Tax=Acidaminococcus fermentans TaxID=905 RepID=UPI0024328270|nr:peptidase T [Acidaminococcus fermentans]MCI7195543.1 peptidase T [Acidaminococcus fermentans]